jgi:hypothetical protein
MTLSTNHILTILLVLVLGTPGLAQLSEDFEGSFPPAGWAVADNGVATSQSWQQSGLNPNGGSSHAYVRFNPSAITLAEDWLITPALQPTAGDNILSFYATDDFATNYGSVYTVRVSTLSQTDLGSFEIVQTLLETDLMVDTYQQFMVDLSAYNDQDIYVAFVLENSNGDSYFLDDVAGPPLAPVTEAPLCDAELVSPANGATDVDLDASLDWDPATGFVDGYLIQIGTAPSLIDVLEPTDVGNNTFYDPAFNFAYGTTYYVLISPYNQVGLTDQRSCTEFTFTTEADSNIELDCFNGADTVTADLCYESDEIFDFIVASNNGAQVQLEFLSGTVEVNQDELYVYDGRDENGNLLNPGMLYGNAGDVSGLTYVSSSGFLYVRLESDGSNDCASGDQTTIQYRATCADCLPAVGSAQAGQCNDQNSEFFIDVDITNTGDGEVIIANDQNQTTDTVTTTGVTSVGPFAFGTVTISLNHSTSEVCNIELAPITINGCASANDDCVEALPLLLSTDTNCNNATTGSTANASPSSIGECATDGPDVWYFFMAPTTEDYLFELSNTDLTSIAIYEGDCTEGFTLVNEDCQNDGVVAVPLTQGVTYYVQVIAQDEQVAGTFDLCVAVLPPAPANDLCSNATILNCPSTSLTNEDATFAVGNGQDCQGDPIGPGIWYRFTGTGGFVTFSVTPDNWDAEIQLWSGLDCQSLSCMLNVDETTTGGTEQIENLQTTMGTEYYLYVGAFAQNERAGEFDLSFSCAGVPGASIICLDEPINDPCDDILIENGNLEGIVEACVSIETSSEVIVEASKSATLKSGGTITLKPGFTAEAGSTFRAYIEDCQANPVERPDDVLAEAKKTQEPLEDLNGLSVEVIPNPVLDATQVRVHLPISGPMEARLTNINGQVVRTWQQTAQEGWNTFQLDRRNLADGWYFLMVQTEQEQVVTNMVFAR